MENIHNNKQIISGKVPEEAEKILLGLVDSEPESAEAWAELGKIRWKLGKRKEAITAYETSAQLDPQGQGAMLLEHSRSIMDFFCTDLLNP